MPIHVSIYEGRNYWPFWLPTWILTQHIPVNATYSHLQEQVLPSLTQLNVIIVPFTLSERVRNSNWGLPADNIGLYIKVIQSPLSGARNPRPRI